MGPITDAHKLTFQKNMEMALGQDESYLDAAFTYITGLSGRIMQMVELYGSHSAVRNLGRKADTPDIDTPVEPVWVHPDQLADGKLMELEDTIKNVMDPQSMFIKAMANAMVVGKDQILRDAIFGARTIGKDGGTTSAWSGDTVGVGIGNTDDTTPIGMNVRKILRGRRYLQERKVKTGREKIFLGLNAQEIEELFRDLTFINADYRNRKPLDTPEDVGILGVTILPPLDGTAAFADYDASTYTAGMWCKSGMLWGEFSPFRSDIPLRADKMNRPHPQMEHWLGATRTEDYKTVKILNKK